MTFKFWIDLLMSAGNNLPALLVFLNAIAAAWHEFQKTTGGKVMASLPNEEELGQCQSLKVAAPLLAFDGGRIAKLIHFLMAHPVLAAGALKAFGINVPPELLSFITGALKTTGDAGATLGPAGGEQGEPGNLSVDPALS